jgi:hypothetical protein
VATKLIETRTFWRDKIRYVLNRRLVGDFLMFARDHSSLFSSVHPERFYSATKDPSIVNSRLVETVLDDFFKQRGVDMKALTKDVYCTPKDLAHACSSKLTCGNHSHSHYVLSSMSEREQHVEIETAQRLLSDIGLPISRVFSIPFGTQRDFNDDTIAILRDLDYLGYVLCAGKGGWDALCKDDKLGTGSQVVALRRFMPTENQRFLFAE